MKSNKTVRFIPRLLVGFFRRDKSTGRPPERNPLPGSTYTVKYRYNENIQPDEVTRDTVKVTGAAKDTNVLIDYAYKLPRIDAVCMDTTGAMV